MILVLMVPVAAIGAGNNLSLMDAVKSGNREAVRALLKQHANGESAGIGRDDGAPLGGARERCGNDATADSRRAPT